MGQANGTAKTSPKSRGKEAKRSAMPSTAQSDAMVPHAHAPGLDPLHMSLTSYGKLPTAPKTPTCPIVLTYGDHGVKSLLHKKAAVTVAVESLNWQCFPMTASTDSFYAILQLPPGPHNYRFYINNTETVDRSQPLAPRRGPAGSGERDGEGGAPRPPEDGREANCVLISEGLQNASGGEEEVADPEEGWGQEEVLFKIDRKFPPIMPLHLRYTPLNTPLTPFRCSPDGKMVILTDETSGDTRPSPEHLPLPLSVTINHVYFQRREDHAVLGMTTRYGNKCSTIVYYTALDSSMPFAAETDTD